MCSDVAAGAVSQRRIRGLNQDMKKTTGLAQTHLRERESQTLLMPRGRTEREREPSFRTLACLQLALITLYQVLGSRRLGTLPTKPFASMATRNSRGRTSARGRGAILYSVTLAKERERESERDRERERDMQHCCRGPPLGRKRHTPSDPHERDTHRQTQLPKMRGAQTQNTLTII